MAQITQFSVFPAAFAFFCCPWGFALYSYLS